MKKKINYNIAFIRAIFCIAVLLYHLNILKGGYLAVCSFFVLTGYYASKSLDSSKSIINYYKKRIFKIYVPLIIVILSTISVLFLLKSNIFNIKPEITSVLLGYNNYWQIGANTDYFARHFSSPFIHLWYISILLQIELIFPFIFILLKKMCKKVNKVISFEILFLLTIVFTIYFYKASLGNNIMNVYYNTLTRVFSYLFGALLYSVHMYYNKMLIFFRRKYMHIFMYIIYLLSLIFMFIFVSSSSKYFAISMILTSFITLRLIEYSIILDKEKIIIYNKIFKFISDISYEIYLVQYPVIYLFENIKMNNVLKVITITLITLIISWIINFSLKSFKKGRVRVLKIIVLIPLLLISCFGLYQYIIMKDHTKEINTLKDKLNENEELMKKKQEEYLQKQEEEQVKFEEYIQSLELNEEELHNKVKNLKIVGIGDSILLDAIDTLYKEFPNGYFDGKISRTTCAGADVLGEIKNKGISWDVLVFSLGTNGYPSDKCKNAIMQYVSDDTQVFWLNATHADYDNNNEELVKYAINHSNIHILDWESVIKEHPEYLYSDYIHLRPQGFKPYAEFIENGIYNYYLENYNQEKEKSINEYKNKQPEKYNFYGNDLLINSYDLLQEDYSDSKFVADNDLDYNKLLKILEQENNLNNKIIFVFDNNSNIIESNYKEIINKYSNHEIYIVTTNKLNLDFDNVRILELEFNEEDYLSDKVHLNKSANKKLVAQIKELLNSNGEI